MGITICSAQMETTHLFKEIDTIKLHMDVIYPPQMDITKDYPAMVLFFGGGWINGNRRQLRRQARYFSQRGVVCFLPDYRTYSVHRTLPTASLKDAKSAIRYIRENATMFHIDKNKLVATGASAGGHLAAACALIDAYNDESTDNISISSVPNALVLFNPVIDNSPSGYGNERLGIDYKTFSPIHNITRGAPPTIIFLGRDDKLIDVETIEKYKALMDEVGSDCDVEFFDHAEHGFFQYGNSFDNFKATLTLANEFLIRQGFLTVQPEIEIIED